MSHTTAESPATTSVASRRRTCGSGRRISAA
jgi:hypothetical protein